MSVKIVRYSSEYKKVWDAFVANSKNATFLFYRDYMEYHADRFEDHSLLFYFNNSLVALLPAHVCGSQVCSHGGLSYGGFLTSTKMKTERMLHVFDASISYFREAGFTAFKYKSIPYIYHQAPAQEDLYALFKHGATVIRRDELSVIQQVQSVSFSRTRRWEVKKALKFGWDIRESLDFETFMRFTEILLKEKYNTKPVHSTVEITKLANRFPDNIKLHVAAKNGNIEAGVIIYETQTVAHCQYIGSTEFGRKNGALSVLLNALISQVYSSKAFFDFGSSIDGSEMEFNSRLVKYKESYGGRTIVHDHYLLKL